MAASRLRHRALYFITPSVGAKLQAQELPALVEDAIRGGVDLIQWRQKPSKNDLESMPELRRMWEQRDTTGFLLPIAKEVRDIARNSGVPFIVNDSIDLALALDADGVHVGQSDLDLKQVVTKLHQSRSPSDFIVGVTVRDGMQARVACENGASYLGAGPVFVSSTKPEANDGNSIGIAGLLDCTSTAREFDIPVYAIGGISIESGGIRQCVLDGGAAGVSMIAAIAGAPDKERAARTIKGQLEQAFLELNA